MNQEIVDAKNKIKEKYIQLIKSLGFTVVYDCDKHHKDELFDLQLLCVKEDKNAKVCGISYYFYQITYMAPLSLNEFANYAKQNNLAEFSEGVKNRMVPYNVDDLVARMLQMGMHIEEFYIDNQVKLTPRIIKSLMSDFNTMGSPLNIKQNPRTKK